MGSTVTPPADVAAAPAPEPRPAAALPEPFAGRLERIRQSVLSHFPRDKTPNVSLLEKAFADAEFHHRDQWRKSGEPYILHPARVALLAAEAGKDVETVIIALLHDVIEDTELTKEAVREQYGEWLAEVVDGLTKVVSGERAEPSGRPVPLGTYRKLIHSTIKDLRTLQVKILDRLDNMRDLGYLSRARQRRISTETMNVYVPMAQRLGMKDIADELTALSFRYHYPKRFKATLSALKQSVQAEQLTVNTLARMLEALLERQVSGTAFTVAPIHHHVGEYVHSETLPERALRGFRITVPEAPDCYRVLGALHMAYRVVPNSIKDYISNPKPNRYQALHSEVFVGGEPLSMVIASGEMERVNAKGILASWTGSTEELYKYYQSYLELLDSYTDGTELRMEDVLRHAQMDTLQMFTPQGDLQTFPQGATVVDFAFAIHTELGTHCAGALMGGRRVGPFAELEDGKVVEVLTDPAVEPSRSWIDAVRTTRAKLAIRRHLNAQANARAQEVGRQLLEGELQRLERSLEEVTGSAAFEQALTERGLTQAQLYQQIGRQRLLARRFLRETGLVPAEELQRLESQERSLFQRYVRPVFRGRDPVLMVREPDDGFFRVHTACAPLRGDPVVGERREGEILIHREQCPDLRAVEPERLLNLGWEEDRARRPHQFSILVRQDQPGIIYRISKVLSGLGVNIVDIGLHRNLGNGQAELRVDIEPVPHRTFRQIVSGLRGIKEVVRVAPFTAAPRNGEEG